MFTIVCLTVLALVLAALAIASFGYAVRSIGRGDVCGWLVGDSGGRGLLEVLGVVLSALFAAIADR